MYDNNQQSMQSISIVKALFSRTSFLTLTVASAAFTLFTLLSTVAASFGNQKNAILASLYYFFGDNSIMAVNLVTGLMVSILFALLTFGMLTSYLGATKNNESQMRQGINIILGSMIYMVILASCLIIIALASVSVTYYNSWVMSDTDNSSSYARYTSYSNSSSLFLVYVLFGAGIMTLIIALIRLVLSIRRAANGINLTTKGSALTLISGIYCASITGISFIVTLCNLVMPYDYLSDNKMPEPTALLILMISVLISAAMTVVLIDLCILTSIYSSSVNRINKAIANDIYSGYATNIYNQTQNRTPYINPVQNSNVPSPQARPYTAQTHAQYMTSINNQNGNSAPVQFQNNTDPTIQSQPVEQNTDNNAVNLDK